MAPCSPVVALLSIKPAYVREILEGRKTVEFRKRGFKRAVTHVVIYASAPVQRVVGWFRTNASEEMSPSALWKKFRTVGGITESAFKEYYGSASAGVAIHVTEPHRLQNPIPLGKITASPPPQSYAYLPANTLKALDSVKPSAPKRLAVSKKRSSIAKAKRSRNARVGRGIDS